MASSSDFCGNVHGIFLPSPFGFAFLAFSSDLIVTLSSLSSQSIGALLGLSQSLPMSAVWKASGGWATLTGEYNSGLPLNVYRNNWGCPTSRALGKVACRAADIVRLRNPVPTFPA